MRKIVSVLELSEIRDHYEVESQDGFTQSFPKGSPVVTITFQFDLHEFRAVKSKHKKDLIFRALKDFGIKDYFNKK